MRKLITILAAGIVLTACNAIPTAETSSSPSSSSAPLEKNSQTKLPAVNLKQEVSIDVAAYDDSGFDNIVTPEKNMKGRYIKTAYPDIMGDTRKFAGTKKITIPRYFVFFDKKAGESAQASTGFTGPTANAHLHAILDGVQQDTFQRITDKAYLDFENKMQQAGYEVIGFSDVKKTQEFQKWDSSKYPDIDSGTAEFLATGMRTFSQFKTYFRHGALMNETQAAVVEPTLSVNFAAFGKESHSTSGFSNSTATASVSFGPVIQVNGLVIGTTLNACEKRGYCYGDQVRASTGQSSYSTTKFGNAAETTSDAVKIVQGITNALSMLSGTSTRSDTEYTVTANPHAYEKAALEALFATNTRLVNKLVAADKD